MYVARMIEKVLLNAGKVPHFLLHVEFGLHFEELPFFGSCKCTRSTAPFLEMHACMYALRHIGCMKMHATVLMTPSCSELLALPNSF